MRRVQCPGCGVRVERVPRATGKSCVTEMLVFPLSDWANRLAWQAVCGCFHENGRQVYKRVKYVFLKWAENLTDSQRDSLQKVMNRKNLKSVRAWQRKEKFQLFGEYDSAWHARRYLRKRCRGAMRSCLKPLTKFVGTLRAHEGLIMNCFEAKKAYSSGAAAGTNRKINLVARKAYGFKNLEVLKIVLFHKPGHLPEPEVTHGF
jgi:transposase